MGSNKKYVRLIRNSKSKAYLMTLPKVFVDELGWDKGDYLKVEIEDGKIVVSRVED